MGIVGEAISRHMQRVGEVINPGLPRRYKYKITLVGKEEDWGKDKLGTELKLRRVKHVLFQKGVGPYWIAAQAGFTSSFEFNWPERNVCVLDTSTNVPIDMDAVVNLSDWGKKVKIEELEEVKTVETPVLPVVIVESSREWAVNPPEATLLDATCDCGSRLEEVTYPEVGSLIYCQVCRLVPELCCCDKEAIN